MKRYYEQTSNGYILSYGISEHTGTEITEVRYNDILDAVVHMPQDEEGISYRLKTNLSYEQITVDPVDPDIDDTEAMSILLGGVK